MLYQSLVKIEIAHQTFSLDQFEGQWKNLKQLETKKNIISLWNYYYPLLMFCIS